MTQLHLLNWFHRFRTRNFYRLVAPGSRSIGPTDFPAFRRSHSPQIHRHLIEELPPKSWQTPFSVEVTLPIFVRTQLRCSNKTVNIAMLLFENAYRRESCCSVPKHYFSMNFHHARTTDFHWLVPGRTGKVSFTIFTVFHDKSILFFG